VKKAWISCGLAVVMAAGCSSQPPETKDSSPYETSVETKTFRDQYFGLGPVSDRFSNRNEGAGELYGEGVPRYSNNGTMNLNIGHDQDMIRYLVGNTEGFDPGLITIVGKDAWVFAKISPQYAEDERKEMTDRLHDSLQTQMPRYDIHLNIDVKRK
jgi:hypothetical protein